MSSQPFKKISNNTKHYKLNSIGSSVKLEHISNQAKSKIIKPIISKVGLRKHSIEVSYNKITILSSDKFNKKINFTFMHRLTSQSIRTIWFSKTPYLTLTLLDLVR